MKSRRIPAEPPSPSADTPTLPAWKAFVVQFTRESGTRRRAFSGRVEHMTSGRRATFRSTRELLAVLRRHLDELGEERH